MFCWLTRCRSWLDRRTRRATDVLSAREGLDDEHRGAAVSAHEGGLGAAVVGAATATLSGRRWRRLMQKISNGSDIVLAVGVGEPAVVADAMKARGQHVQQEAAHELLGRQAHCFVACTPVFAVVLPAEGNTAIIQCHEP